MAGEFERIDAIRRRVTRDAEWLRLGIGDDAAVIRPEPGFEVVVSTDLMVEDVHFRRAWTTAELLGRKALAISLSDLAACGAMPRAAFFSLALPADINDAFLDHFYTGVSAVGDRYGVAVAGGDLSLSPGPLFIDAIAYGEVEAGRALKRSGARAGDGLYVSGSLGSAAAGLEQLTAGVTLDSATTGNDLDAIRSQLAPTARIELGRSLLQTGLATAAIDISDGLSSDIRHLCDASGVGATIDAEAIPTVHEFEHALHGGEQYELLFAADPENEERLALVAHQLKTPVTRIGTFGGPSTDVLLKSLRGTEPLEPRGWDHFRR